MSSANANSHSFRFNSIAFPFQPVLSISAAALSHIICL
jgi:hypothetical protein